MKIFSAEQIREADNITIKNQDITSDALMERAGHTVFEWIDKRLAGKQTKMHIFCGVGNNGGDGMVLGRLLLEHGYNVEVYIVDFSKNRSSDFLLNLDRIKSLKYWPEVLEITSEFPKVEKNDIILDCIFGVGLNRSPEVWVGKIIENINRSGAFIISVDMPSGLFTDRVPEELNQVVQPNTVLTFQVPKLVFFLPQTGNFALHWEIMDIGLDKEFLSQATPEATLVGHSEAKLLYRKRNKFSHKGTFGHVAIIGGSYGKIGAPLMAAEAALNAGCGLVTAFIPVCGYQTFQTAFPEAMVHTDLNENYITNISLDFEPSVIGIGPGMGRLPETKLAFGQFLKTNKQPLVLDADALNLLSENKELLKMLPPKSILTPHPKEFERLAGKWADDFEKLKKAKEFSQEHNCILVLKGAHSLVVCKEEVFVNNSGNPGMATGGSGDVLTGILSGLLAQGYPPLEAAVFGAYLHGLAGDLAASRSGYEALTATDIIDFLGDAYLHILQNESKFE